MTDRAVAGTLMKRAAAASVAVAATLIFAKVGAWLATDSVAVLSSLLDSLLDAAASVINLVAVRHALTPADDEHRFGHGKAEPLAGLAQSAFICGSALILLMEAMHRFATPQAVQRPEIGVAVAVFSIVLSAGLVLYQRRVVARTGSVAIAADSLHYGSDALLNGAVVAAILIGAFLDAPLVDPVFGAAISLWILWGAIRIARQSFDLLMDRELPAGDRARILAIARAQPDVLDVHDLRTRSAGTHIFVQMHIELDPDMRLARAHAVADAVELDIRAAYPRAEIIIHQDPAGEMEPHRAAAAP